MVMTQAERARRYRERQKVKRDARAADRERKRSERARDRMMREDLSVNFLKGVILDAQKAAADGTAQPWMLARAAQAVDLLNTVLDAQASAEGLPSPVAVAHNAQTDDERAALLKFHEAQFDRWLDRSERTFDTGRAAAPQAVEHARLALSWADEERRAGRSTSASVTQGLTAAKRLLNSRHERVIKQAHREYTDVIVARSLIAITNGRGAPYNTDPTPQEEPTDD